MQNVRLLLAHGADVNEHDSGGNTAATYAAGLAKFDVVEMLLRHGYDYDLEGLALSVNNRVGPEYPKSYKQMKKVLEMLKKRGVVFPLPPPGIAGPPPGVNGGN